MEYHKAAMPLIAPRVKSALFSHALQWFGQVWRSLRQLWLETTGSLFLCMGALAIPSALKEWHRYEQSGSPWRFFVVVLFMTMTLSFGIFSFVRSRRLR
jgi:hypothetical protein